MIGQIWKNLQDEQTYLILNHYIIDETDENCDIVNNRQWHYKAFCVELNRTFDFHLNIPVEDDEDYWKRLA